MVIEKILSSSKNLRWKLNTLGKELESLYLNEPVDHTSVKKTSCT